MSLNSESSKHISHMQILRERQYLYWRMKKYYRNLFMTTFSRANELKSRTLDGFYFNMHEMLKPHEFWPERNTVYSINTSWDQWGQCEVNAQWFYGLLEKEYFTMWKKPGDTFYATLLQKQFTDGITELLKLICHLNHVEHYWVYILQK